jgi:acyl transferase domain-containing protein
MRLPVRFLDAARGMVQLSGKRSLKMRQKVRINTVLEIGPHSALQRPVKEILESIGMAKEVKYTPLLVRDASSVSTIAHCLGRLFAMGHEVTIQNFNRCHDKVSLPTLPEYPFDHSQTHWYESTTSKNFRLRKHARHDLLGTTVLDWNPLEPTWRKTIRISETPWVEDHKASHRSFTYVSYVLIAY